MEIDERWIRERITALRMKKGVSEYRMSYDLGHSRGYMQNISSGRSLPPMSEFLEICRYLDVTPQAFFDVEAEDPAQLREANALLRRLEGEDLSLAVALLRRLADGR